MSLKIGPMFKSLEISLKTHISGFSFKTRSCGLRAGEDARPPLGGGPVALSALPAGPVASCRQPSGTSDPGPDLGVLHPSPIAQFGREGSSIWGDLP